MDYIHVILNVLGVRIAGVRGIRLVNINHPLMKTGALFATLAKRIVMKKGDLVRLKPEYNNDPWANQLGIILSLERVEGAHSLYNIYCKGKVFTVPDWSMEKVIK